MSSAPTVTPAGGAIVRGIFAGPIRSLHSPRVPGGPATAWRSAILKSAHAESAVGALGLQGDAQKEKKHHGGPLKAVLVYGTAHYARWDMSLRPHAVQHREALRGVSSEVDASVYAPGAFGENVAVDQLTETSVCLGDLWRIGSCVLRVTEPRGPCATLTRRWMRPELLHEVRETAAAGWYNAVHEPGTIRVGDTMVLVQRVQDEWTVERVFHLLEGRTVPRTDIVALLDHPVTTSSLRAHLERRLRTPRPTRD